MPTVAIAPSLETTQAVGALLLHQFARERFSEAGVDQNLIREAEDREHLDALVSTLLYEDEHEDTNSYSYNATSKTDNNHIDGDRTTSGGDENGHTSFHASVNNTTARSDDGPSELFHSIAEFSVNGTPQRADRTLYHSMNASNPEASESPFERLQASPCFTSLGAKLRRIADEFKNSPGRLEVKELAEGINLKDLTKDYFVVVLEALFEKEIDRAGIVALFFFCTDVALRAAQSARELVVNLLGWSFTYIVQRVCSFVHNLGGWDKVLPQPIFDFIMHQAPSIVSVGCALVILWIGIRIRRIFT